MGSLWRCARSLPFLALIFFAFGVFSARADTVRALAFGFSPGVEYNDIGVSGYRTKAFGPAFTLSVGVPMGSVWDLSIRSRFYATLASSVGVGASGDAVFRWFPLTFNRMPEFKAGNQELKYKYSMMPYLGWGFGVSMQSVQKVDEARFLAVYPRLSTIIGSYFPLSQSFALNAELSFCYGDNLNTGNIYVRVVSAGAALGVAVFY